MLDTIHRHQLHFTGKRLSQLSGFTKIMVSPHIGAAVDCFNVDLNLQRRQKRAASNEADSTTFGFISRLWDKEENKELVKAFLENELCKICALNKDPKAKAYYTEYMVQDYWYLEDYVKFRGLRLNTFPLNDVNGLVEEAASVGASGTWVKEQFALLAELGVGEAKLAETERSVAEIAYSSFLQSNASREDWFVAHVMTIPCIYGWTQIAKKLEANPQTDKTSVFYKTWVKPNLSMESANSHSIRFLGLG